MLYRSQSARFLSLIAVLALAACGKDDSAASSAATATPGTSQATTAQVEEDLADVTEYRLSMEKIDKYLAAQRNIANKAASLTPEQRQALQARSDASGDANASIDDMAKRIESEPMMVAAIKEAGLSAREFTMITISMMQTGMAAAVLKMRPSDNQDSLIREMKANPENVKFYNANEAEIMRKSKELEETMKKLGMSNDS